MTDNLPAVVQPEPSREVTVADTDSWIGVAQDVIRLANLIAPTEFVPRQLRDSAPATAAAILYGREVGLPPMTALTMTHVIEGKPAMSAEAMRGLIMAAGHELQYVESTGARCVVRGRRFGSEGWTLVEWTIDMARQAGLLSKSNWKSYPADMLVARATARLARMVFPDVIHGFRAIEEFEGGDDLPGEPELPAGPTTRVGRATKKAAAKKTAPAPLEERQERPAGPPLPGENGYTEPELPQTTQPDTETTSEPDTQTTEPEPAVGADPGPVTEEPPAEGEGEAPEAGGTEEEPAPPRMASRAQHRMIFGLMQELDVRADQDRHDAAGAIAGRPVSSFNDLTVDDAKKVIDTLTRLESRDQLDAILAGGDQ